MKREREGERGRERSRWRAYGRWLCQAQAVSLARVFCTVGGIRVGSVVGKFVNRLAVCVVVVVVVFLEGSMVGHIKVF